jgi:hypothetical protein
LIIVDSIDADSKRPRLKLFMTQLLPVDLIVNLYFIQAWKVIVNFYSFQVDRVVMSGLFNCLSLNDAG